MPSTIIKKNWMTKWTPTQPPPPPPTGGGFPVWWEKAETWAPTLFTLFRRERAYYQAQIQLAKKEITTVLVKIQAAKPSRTTIKTQPIATVEKAKTTTSVNMVSAKPSQTTITAAPLQMAEPALKVIPSKIKIFTYPELAETVSDVELVKLINLIKTVKVIRKKRKR
jgi:hypothetical protein